MPKIGIALVGYGIIGTGVIEVLNENGEAIRKKTGIDLELKYIIDKDLTTKRRADYPSAKKSDDYKTALNDPEIQIIIELVGGTGFAYTLVEESLKAGKNVVTANKALIAERGIPLFELARKAGKAIGFEGSVAGGIPIIRTVSDGLAGDEIKSIYGIVNGTTNYILTKMYEEGQDFDAALKQAQKLGFAEADPALDIGGFDAAHKAAILASVAFNSDVDFKLVNVEGVTGIELEDINNAEELGYIVKLLAVAKLDSDRTMEVRVNPTLVPMENQLAFIRNEFNAVMVESEFLGSSMYYGKGAGSRPTAVAVVSDILDIAKSLENPVKTMKYNAISRYKMKHISDIETRYYIRFNILDKMGVLSRISGVFADHHISIASVIQKERSENDYVPLVMTTHTAKEKNVMNALDEIEKMDFNKKRGVIMRILD